MINERLKYFLEKNEIINPFQSGFREGRSTLDQLLRLQHDVKKSQLKSEYVLAVFLDLQNAFDLTWHKGLLFKLKEYGITGTIFKWIRSFLQGRSIQVRVGSSLSQREHLSRGTPQGSVISPTLFNIIINDFAKIVSAKDSGIIVSQFADDSSEWMSGKASHH